MFYFISFFSCSDNKNNGKASVNPKAMDYSSDTLELYYTHKDPSISPEYHRSYTIQATDPGVSFIVYAYSDTLYRFSKSLTKNEFNSFVESLMTINIKSVEGKATSIECTGNSTESLCVIIPGRMHIYGYEDDCGGYNLEGDVDSVKMQFVKLIPNFSKKLGSIRYDEKDKIDR